MDLEVPELIKACRELYALPQGLNNTHAHAFFTEFPFERLFRCAWVISGKSAYSPSPRLSALLCRTLSKAHDTSDVSIVSSVLSRLLATDLGESQPKYCALASPRPAKTWIIFLDYHIANRLGVKDFHPIC